VLSWQKFPNLRMDLIEVADKVPLVSFRDYDLGFFDEDCGRAEPALNPWLPEKV